MQAMAKMFNEIVVLYRKYEKERIQVLENEHSLAIKKLAGEKQEKQIKEILAKKSQVSQAGSWLSKILEDNPPERDIVRNRLEKEVCLRGAQKK